MSCQVAVLSLTTLATMHWQSSLSSETLMSSFKLSSMSFHNIRLSCPDTSVSDAPSLSFHLSFPSSLNSPDHVFSTRAPGKQAAVDEFFSLVYDIPLPFKILPHYFSSLSAISLASSARTKLPRPSTCPSSVSLFYQ